jgi:hypothetical protein
VAVKWILRHSVHKPHFGLWYPKESTFDLIGYSDSDYVGCKVDMKSTLGTCLFFWEVPSVLELKETEFRCPIHR